MSYASQEYRDDLGAFEIANIRGLPEYGFFEKGSWFPVCSQCMAHTRGNHGQGTMCDSCILDDIKESSHDGWY